MGASANITPTWWCSDARHISCYTSTKKREPTAPTSESPMFCLLKPVPHSALALMSSGTTSGRLTWGMIAHRRDTRNWFHMQVCFFDTTNPCLQLKLLTRSVYEHSSLPCTTKRCHFEMQQSFCRGPCRLEAARHIQFVMSANKKMTSRK